MRFDVVTLFPELFEGFQKLGVVGKAFGHYAHLTLWNPRDYTPYPRNQVDDRPYGGGPGMVMMAEPIFNTLKAIKESDVQAKKSCVVCLSASGQLFNHALIEHFNHFDHMVLIAGRYEGIDQRVIQEAVDYEVSIGDYVLSGGELPCMIFIDALLRQIKGVLGNPDSAAEDSFVGHRLDYPHYTAPREIQGKKVPEVLLNGNHKKIAQWRKTQSLLYTQKNRPDLLKQKKFSAEEKELLKDSDCACSD